VLKAEEATLKAEEAPASVESIVEASQAGASPHSTISPSSSLPLLETPNAVRCKSLAEAMSSATTFAAVASEGAAENAKSAAPLATLSGAAPELWLSPAASAYADAAESIAALALEARLAAASAPDRGAELPTSAGVVLPNEVPMVEALEASPGPQTPPHLSPPPSSQQSSETASSSSPPPLPTRRQASPVRSLAPGLADATPEPESASRSYEQQVFSPIEDIRESLQNSKGEDPQRSALGGIAHRVVQKPQFTDLDGMSSWNHWPSSLAPATPLTRRRAFLGPPGSRSPAGSPGSTIEREVAELLQADGTASFCSGGSRASSRELCAPHSPTDLAVTVARVPMEDSAVAVQDSYVEPSPWSFFACAPCHCRGSPSATDRVEGTATQTVTLVGLSYDPPATSTLAPHRTSRR